MRKAVEPRPCASHHNSDLSLNGLTSAPYSDSSPSPRGLSYSMDASYDDNTTFAEDEKGMPICFDWLRDMRDQPRPPVRVRS